MFDHLSDVAAVAVFGGLFVGYFLLSGRRGRRAPDQTTRTINHAVRDSWVRYIMEDPSRALLGVQTLRNSTMAATFFASTAVLLIIGTLNLLDHAERFAQAWGGVVVTTSTHQIVWTIKVLALIGVLFSAFFTFAISVRFFNHVGYHLAVAPEHRPDWLTVDTVAGLINRAGRYYTLGMRAFFLAVPLVFWLFGPIFLIVASIVTVVVMNSLEQPTGREKGANGPRR